MSLCLVSSFGWSEVHWALSVGPSFVSTPLPSMGTRRRLVLPLLCSVLQPHLLDSPPLLVTKRMAYTFVSLFFVSSTLYDQILRNYSGKE